MPKLYVIPQPAPNAFATGRIRSMRRLPVTAGLMELMTDDELEGVIAHELSHVRNYDILITSIAATLAGAITWIVHGSWAMIFGGFGGSRDDNRGGGGLAALIMLIVAPIVRNVDPARDFLASVSSPPTAFRRTHGWASVRADQRPRKLGAYNKRIPMDVPPATASLFIVAP